MGRRSRSASNVFAEAQEIQELLGDFISQLDSSELRERVRRLIPIVHKVRDLGSGLISSTTAKSASDRLLAYLRKYPRTVIEGDELMVVSGIGEWARRVRELRKEQGWWIYSGSTFKQIAEAEPETAADLERELQFSVRSVGVDDYVLVREEQDREAAYRWNLLNTIRNQPGSVQSKILTYLRQNAGHLVTGEELRYLAKDKSEWARRVRELRTEQGWPIVSRMQGRSDLPIGAYVLEEDKQAPEHDRKISDPVRIEVLNRDSFACRICRWKRDDFHPDDPRRSLELHHVIHHVRGGGNSAENLITLCNVHHDDVHAGRLDLNARLQEKF
jgi:hypothetical protein